MQSWALPTTNNTNETMRKKSILAINGVGSFCSFDIKQNHHHQHHQREISSQTNHERISTRSRSCFQFFNVFCYVTWCVLWWRRSIKLKRKQEPNRIVVVIVVKGASCVGIIFNLIIRLFLVGYFYFSPSFVGKDRGRHDLFDGPSGMNVSVCYFIWLSVISSTCMPTRYLCNPLVAFDW